MTFLYVGLGIAMISGISAMLQLGNNINNFTLVSTLKNNEYYQSLLLPSQDRKIMEFLNSYSGPDNDVCLEVKKDLNKYLTLNEGLYNGEEEGISSTPSNHEFLVNSCVLVNNKLSHRVLIKKNKELGTFNLFSCYLKNEIICPYEVNK